MEEILSVQGLGKAYPGFALEDVCFSVAPGQIMGLIGRNGAGKTTTLKALLNFVHPDGGEIRFFGLPFIYPMDPVTGTVSLSYGTLNLRSYPSSTGTVIASIPNGASVTVYGEWQGWYVVHYRNYVGYAAAAYIDT